MPTESGGSDGTSPLYREPANVSNETDILNYIENMKNNGRATNTTTARNRCLRQLALECNLRHPEQVKAIIANKKWNTNTKHKIVNNYANFLKYLEIEWTAPTYKTANTDPFIPLETEIDQLIATLGRRTMAFIQLLKETGMRSGEATLLKWTDLNTEQKTIAITPEKGSNPRTLPISDKAIALLNKLTKDHEKIFYQELHTYRTAF
jgi:integrase